MEDELDWPPPAARYRSALWRAEGHIERGEYGQAAHALASVFELAGEDERDLVRGLHHLAAAGYRARDGETERALRQLEHARRRLAPFLPEHEEVDLAGLIELVEAAVRS